MVAATGSRVRRRAPGRASYAGERDEGNKSNMGSDEQQSLQPNNSLGGSVLYREYFARSA